MASILEHLKDELEHLRKDRDRLREQLEQREKHWEQREQQWEQREQQWEQREQQWEQREQQWEQREKEWEHQRDDLSREIGDLKDTVKDLGLQLKTQMGKVPSSEKGAPLAKAAPEPAGGQGGGSDSKGAPPPVASASSHQEQKYLAGLRALRSPAPEGMKEASSHQDWWEAQGSEPQCIPPPATIFGSQLFDVSGEERDFSFTTGERRQLFGRHKGLHSKKDKCTVHGLNLGVSEITCWRENLSDLGQGLYFRKANQLGPSGSQMSWDCLAKIVALVAEYAFPMERLARALSHSYFSSANISRWFVRSASAVSPVYVAMGKALSRVSYLKADDTSALVLDLRKEAKAGLTPDRQMTGEEWEAYLNKRRPKKGIDLVTPVLEAFGRVALRVDGKGAKISLNTTLVSGRLDACDYRSTVYFYRTHFGQAGNLLSRILEHRSSADQKAVVIQGDSSAQNHLEQEIAAKIKAVYIGCLSHARRPFYRYRERDKQLAFCLLRCFRILAMIEATIQRGPLTQARILRYRRRYGVKVWRIIESICQTVMKGHRHPLADNHLWKKGDKLYDGCAYILKHLSELQYYLSHAEINPDNNSSEQGLRGEKLIENSSYFRKSEPGRIALDIHRSLIASCNACGLSYRDYLQYVMESDPKVVAEQAELYFPHAVAYAIRNRSPPAASDDTASTTH